MDLDSLADRLETLANQLRTRGQTTMARTADWQHRTIQGLHVLTTGDDPEVPHATGPAYSEAEQAALRRINSYHDRYRRSLRQLDRHAHTVISIIAEATPPRERLPDTPAQVALEGWCRSCHRNHGHLEPIAQRPDGTPKYRDLCNGCGEWAATHDGAHPPLAVLEIRHAGRRVTGRDYERIMGRKPA